MRRFIHLSTQALKVILVTILFLMLGTVIFLNSNYFDAIIRNLIQTKLAKAINREVTVESVAFNPFRLDVHLTNFKIGNDPRSPETPFLTADEIYARVSWRHLFSGKLQISGVRLVRPSLAIMFYKGGGNNWIQIKKKQEPKKKGRTFVIDWVDVQDMTVLFDQRRIPLSFSCTNQQTHVEYDPVNKNYMATTNFDDGFLKIQDFNFWKFDLRTNYRIVHGHVEFEKLHFLSPESKFWMKGTMSNLKDPYFDMHFGSSLSLEQAKYMFKLGPQMSGNGAFGAHFLGTFGKFHMKGKGDFRTFRFYSLPIDHATFDLEMTENSLKVTKINADMFEGKYNGTFSIMPLKGNSIFKTDATWKNWDGRALTKLIRMNDMVMPITADGKASMRWEEKGGIKNMTGDFRFHIEPYQGMPLDLAAAAENTKFDNALFQKQFFLPFSNDTTFRIEGRQMRGIKSHLETLYTTADFTGTIDLSGSANLDVKTHSEKISEIDLMFHYLQAYFNNKPIRSQEFWAVKGSADFDGKMDATVWSPFKPRMTGQVLAQNVTYHGMNMDTVRGDIQFYDKLIQIFDSEITRGKATGAAQAKFFLEDKSKGIPNALDLTGSVKDFPIVEIPPAFGMQLPVRGTVNASIVLKGPFSELEGESDFEAFHGDAWGEKWDRATGKVLFLADSLGLRDVTAYLDGGYAKASGDLTYDTDEYTVNFEAEKIPLDRLTILKQAGLEISGIANANGSGAGSFKRPALEGQIQIQDLIYKNQMYGNVNSNVTLEPGILKLEASGIARGIPSVVKAEARLDGKIPFTANFDIEKFPLEIITHAYAPETEKVTGLIGGKFDMSGNLYPAEIQHITGALDMIQLDVLGLQLTQARPLNVQLKDNVIEIQDSSLVGDSTQITLTGKIFVREKGRLDLNLSANVGLEILSHWNKSIVASGPSITRVAIGGTIRQPTLTGVMEIKSGNFRHESLPNSLTDISALMTFKNRDISLQSFRANSSGGALTAGGTGRLQGYALATYRFDVYAEKVRVQYPQGLRSTASGEIHLQKDQKKSYLVGDINILQGIYTRSFEESPDVFSYARVPSFVGLTGAVGPLEEVQLNIRIHSDNLLVNNNFANMQTSANLTVIGTFNDPVVTGRVEVVKGEVTFRDRDYKVVRGSLDFSNPYRTEPQLNFIAETRIREYQITLTFNGTFDRIYHDISSDPPLSKDDLYALLGVGNTPDQFQGVEVSALIAGEEISRFVTSPLTKGFRRAFGLQRFTIDPTYVQSSQVATARITVQKDITKDFSITYSTNLFTVAEEIIFLQYQLSDEIQITAAKDELSRYGVDVLVTKTFE